jgi:hypothetical protein
MGNACGGVCCSNDGNVDLNGQVEDSGKQQTGQRSGYTSHYSSNPNSGIMKERTKLSFKKIMEMPEQSKERKQINGVITMVNAVIRGFIQRQQFKKLQFLNLVAGKKANQISKEDINKVPTTKVLMVKLKDRNFGRLPLTREQLRIIKEN